MDKDQCIAELKERINCLLKRNYKLAALLYDIRQSMVIFKDDIDIAIGVQDQDKACCFQDHNRTVEGK